MLNIEKQQRYRMSFDGDSVLRGLQDRGISLLDLFVRESIQNSLDAAKPNTDDSFIEKFNKANPPVIVNLDVDTFSFHDLAKHFEKLSLCESKLGDSSKPKFLSISDRNTVGLRGPLCDTELENYSNKKLPQNLRNLVYNVGVPQDKIGAGGSWGYGKTIYYRLGRGFVIFYSRIKVEFPEEYRDEDEILDGGDYQSRLVACLIEKPDDLNALFGRQNLDSGIAWWGECYPDAQSAKTRPITDPTEIKSILNVFGLQPYSGTETGTTIIIPFINEEKLLENAKQYSKNCENGKVGSWLKGNAIEECLETSLQRWYAPRINNDFYYRKQKQRFLKIFINQQELRLDSIPLFRIVQEMYNYSWRFRQNSDDKSEMYAFPIEVKKTKQTGDDRTLGTLVTRMVTKDELEMTPPNNLDNPYCYFDVEETSGETGNPPIVFYTRKPGMIIKYNVDNDWTSGILPAPEGSYLLALFVLNSEKEDLEEYVRSTETASHTAWEDTPEVNEVWGKSIRTIRNAIIANIKSNYQVLRKKRNTSRKTDLGQVLQELLAPKDEELEEEFIKNIGGTGKRKRYLLRVLKKADIRAKVSNCIIDDGKIHVQIELVPKTQCKLLDFDINLLISGSGEILFPSKWIEIFNGEQFPFYIDSNSLRITVQHSVQKTEVPSMDEFSSNNSYASCKPIIEECRVVGEHFKFNIYHDQKRITSICIQFDIEPNESNELAAFLFNPILEISERQ